MNENIVKKKRRNVYIDLFRYVLSFLVICIHISYTVFDFNFLPICRLAVPMFFVISGYFAFSKDKDRELAKAKTSMKRNLQYFAIVFVIYFIFYDIVKLLKGTITLKNYFYKLFNVNMLFDFFFFNKPTFGSQVMWFVLALFVLSIFHYLICKTNKQKLYYVLLPVCLMVYFVMFSQKVDIWYIRNWLFCGLPCFLAGYFAKAFIETKENKKTLFGILEIVCAIGFLCLGFLEDKIFPSSAYYLSSILSAVCFLYFFDFLNNLGKNEEACNEGKFNKFFYNWIGDKGAFYIYIIHVFFDIYLSEVLPINFGLNVLVFVLSFAVYEMFFLAVKFTKHLIKKKSK